MERRFGVETFGMQLVTGHYASRLPREVQGRFRTEQGGVVLDVSFPQRVDLRPA